MITPESINKTFDKKCRITLFIHKSELLHTPETNPFLRVSTMQKIFAYVSEGCHPEGMTIYGYARVSTDGQTLDAQRAALVAAGATKVFHETASGLKSDRKELAKMLKVMGAGDTLLITRLDRLARSTRDLLNILDTVPRAGALFRSLGDPWADTTTAHGRLMLTVLGGLAEFERELIVARTSEGRARAKARGQHMGRPPKLTAHQRAEALRALADGSATQADLARRFNVSQSTISRLGDKLCS